MAFIAVGLIGFGTYLIWDGYTSVAPPPPPKDKPIVHQVIQDRALNFSNASNKKLDKIRGLEKTFRDGRNYFT